MERWTRLILRSRWLVLATWLVVFLASFVAMSGLNDLFESSAGLPGTDAQRVEDILKEHLGQKSQGNFTLVVRAENGSATSILPAVERAARRATAALPTGQLASVKSVSDTTVIASITSRLDVPDAKPYTKQMRAAIGRIDGAESFLTGNGALQYDEEPISNHDLKVGELYLAIPIALAILIFIFGTLAFLLPLLIALIAIPTTLAVVWVFAHWLAMEQSVQQLVTFIGLGIAIDYSLFIVYRYRDELKVGGTKVDALARTMSTAGRAVLFSGTAVAIGLALLLFMPVPALRGFGLAGLVIPLVSIACALTILPVLLYFLERPLDRVRLIPKRMLERRESAEEAGSFWWRLAHTIMRRPVVFAATAMTVLILAAVPLFDIQLGPGTNEILPPNLESTRGLRVMEEAVGAGQLNPTEIIVDTGRSGGATDAGVEGAVGRLVVSLNNDPEVGLVAQDIGPSWVDRSGRYLRLEVIGKHDPGLAPAKAFVHRLRDDLIPAAGFPTGVTALAGGGAPGGVDFIERTYGTFPWLVLTVLVLTYVLLLRAFRSLLLPLKAIVLNLLSICAAYGLMVAAFQWGAGDPFGLVQYDQIGGWIPVFLFAMLFGLSMDYEVFLVSRMREEWDRTHDNRHAVSLGLAKTGRLVTAAGLIMFAAFMGFVVGSFVDLQEFGFGVAAAILIDVTIVRALLLPSAMALFGRWNWWLPASVARVFRVEPSPLEPKAAPEGPPVPAL
jgi:putative drug exporter of the RND superfamily